ncbi:hypothetical protein BOO69_02985 [Sulfitobacter alexandrii]|uniref:TRAP transporter small permease protein n=1 Tax=Sulfitobacter alexandrii TaxID=1917485 RepID=A0A1J0WDU6_9RHOB|nr:TRAP transporter small permease [Sulfitobacter alexandrii]APE42493.1 hypothetical protein BOO69_02985 [Sulfitobacter alexandrii]
MRRFAEFYQRFLDLIEKATFAVAMTLTAALFLVTSLGIITEQTTGNSLVWTEEINNLLFAWIIFLGAGAIARRGGHIGVDLIHGYIGPRGLYALRVLYAALAMIVVFVMVWYGHRMAMFVGRSQTSLYLDISLYYYYLSIPAGGVIFGLMTIGTILPGTPKREDELSQLEEIPE